MTKRRREKPWKRFRDRRIAERDRRRRANAKGGELVQEDEKEEQGFPKIDLGDTDLDEADLREANLEGTTVINEQSVKDASLKGAIMPGGTRHE